MAIIVDTKDAAGLLAALREEIKSGKVTGWEIYAHENVEYFTQASGSWKKQAYFKAVVMPKENKLKLAFYGAGKPLKRIVYADYHGKFIVVLLDRFENKFNYASAGSKAISIDKFTLEN